MNPRLPVALGGAHLTLFISSVDSCQHSVIKAFLRSAFGDTFTDGSSPETAIKEYLIDINSSTTKQLVQFLQSRHRSCDLLHVIAKLMQLVKSPSSDSSFLLWPRRLNNAYL